MDRKFLLAALCFMLLLTGYNQFVLLPRAQKQKQAAEQELAETKKEMAASLPVSKVQETTRPEELISFQAPTAQITFSSKGAGIKKFLYQDTLGEVDLTPYAGEGYFATLPQLDFQEVQRTQHSISFAASVLPGVELIRFLQFHSRQYRSGKRNILFRLPLRYCLEWN